MAIMRLEWKMAQFSSLPLLIPPQCMYICIASMLSPLLLTVPVEHVQFACSLVSRSLPLFLLVCHNHPQTNSWRQPKTLHVLWGLGQAGDEGVGSRVGERGRVEWRVGERGGAGVGERGGAGVSERGGAGTWNLG